MRTNFTISRREANNYFRARILVGWGRTLWYTGRVATVRGPSRCLRRKGRILLAVLVGAVGLGLSPVEAEDPAQGRFFVLDNGLKVLLYEKHDVPLFNMAVCVDLGSKDETDETNGLVHLLEHCLLFRGSEAQAESEIMRNLRRHGAVVNAHTGQDVSLFEISLPSEHADFALKHQKDTVFGLELSQEELDAEKTVVLEEMNQLKDDPMKSGFDLVFRQLFMGHPYGRSVYGREDVIRGARVEELKAFHRRYFVPNNCAVTVVGDFIAAEMERKIRAALGTLERADLGPRPFVNVSLLRKSREVRREMDISQAYLFIGFVGPETDSPDQYAMDVLVETMGGGINPLLNSVLRGRRNLVQKVEMRYFANRFGGAAVATMSLDPKDLTTAAREATTYLKRCSNESFSKDDYYGEARYTVFDHLESAKNQIRFSVQRNLESGLNLALSFARYVLLTDHPGEIRYLDAIASLRSTDLRRVASAYLGKGEPVIVSLVPDKISERRE